MLQNCPHYGPDRWCRSCWEKHVREGNAELRPMSLFRRLLRKSNYLGFGGTTDDV